MDSEGGGGQVESDAEKSNFRNGQRIKKLGFFFSKNVTFLMTFSIFIYNNFFYSSNLDCHFFFKEIHMKNLNYLNQKILNDWQLLDRTERFPIKTLLTTFLSITDFLLLWFRFSLLSFHTHF